MNLDSLMAELDGMIEEKTSFAAKVALKDVAWKFPSVKNLGGKVGKFKMRLLPEADGRSFKKIGNHWLRSNYNPLRPKVSHSNIYCFSTYGEECKICNVLEKYRPMIFAKKDDYDIEDWKGVLKFQTASQYLINAVIHSDTHPSSHSDIVDYGKDKNVILQLDNTDVLVFIKKEISHLLEAQKDHPEANINPNILDINDGYNLIFEKEAQKLHIMKDPVRSAVEERFLDGRYNIDDFFQKDEKYDIIMNDIATDLEAFLVDHFMLYPRGQAPTKKPVEEDFDLPDVDPSFGEKYRKPPEHTPTVTPQVPMSDENIPPSQRRSTLNERLHEQTKSDIKDGKKECFGTEKSGTDPECFDCNDFKACGKIYHGNKP